MIYEVYHCDGVAMIDRDGDGIGNKIEEEFMRCAIVEQRMRALLGMFGAVEFAAHGGRLDA